MPKIVDNIAFIASALFILIFLNNVVSCCKERDKLEYELKTKKLEKTGLVKDTIVTVRLEEK